MQTTFKTIILGFGNHAAIEIPISNLKEIGGNKRAPLKVTINKEYVYQSTATVMAGKCLVVFPTRDRIASGVNSGDSASITLELDSGYREVNIPAPLEAALKAHDLWSNFHDLIYSKRKEFARQVKDAKTEETRNRRVTKIIEILRS